MKAFLGMGLLGSNFVKAMLKQGEQVQVWNRTHSKAMALEADGAKAFENVEDAVKGAGVIHLTLKDDAAVNEVLANAKPGLQAGAIIIDHSTTSAEGAIARTKSWEEAGFQYVHAPVFMGPINALESTGNMLISGDQELIAKLTPELFKITGKLVNLGEVIGKAAGIKLIGNLFLISLTAGLVDALSLAKGLDIPLTDVTDLFKDWNPATNLTGRLEKMVAGNFDSPSWELSMARKDAGLMMDAASNSEQQLITIPEIAKVMDAQIEKGNGNKDWMVIATS
ncbi:NAD(P)-dependent oxidoreductase [Pedobacter sp. JCM 36344]|uniref:NAD(P)-dependent oxidoreductase n=1 Tax=Pedobacter sp. JCM 36344 TaxID=3374280 RepID=UPI00397B18CB